MFVQPETTPFLSQETEGMEKKHILLVENNENRIEFFVESLEESGLTFLCSTARNLEQAAKILKNTVPEIVFINVGFAKTEGCEAIKKFL